MGKVVNWSGTPADAAGHASDGLHAPTLGMAQRSAHLDFSIRDETGGFNTTVPHRHSYFQIQVNLTGHTQQRIGGAIRPFGPRTLAFIQPHRLHLIPHAAGDRFVLINVSPAFLLPHLACDPLDLDDVPLSQAPELAPFRYQEQLDFHLLEAAFDRVLDLLRAMVEADRERCIGTELQLRGLLLSLIGVAVRPQAAELHRLAAQGAERRGRREALQRVTRHIREQVASPDLSLKGAAAAAFLSPNHLTHVLRKETGLSFTELVLQRRMHLARTLLLNGDRSMGFVARACGFADEAYFSRRFRQTYGLSPSAYRRAERSAAAAAALEVTTPRKP